MRAPLKDYRGHSPGNPSTTAEEAAEAKPPAGQGLAGGGLPEHGEGAVGAVDADPPQAEGVGGGLVASLLGGEGRGVAALASRGADRCVVVAVRVGEDRQRRGEALTQFCKRAGQLLLSLGPRERGEPGV